MTSTIIKTKEKYNQCRRILRDKNFSLNYFWFKRIMFEKLIISNWNIQYKTSLKLLKVYNNYYNTKLLIDDLFIWERILNKKTIDRNVELKLKDDWWESLNIFIDKVLELKL